MLVLRDRKRKQVSFILRRCSMNLQLETSAFQPFAADGNDVLTLTEAARRLGISPSALADLVLRRRLRRLVDLDEPNSTKRGRVLAADVDAELARRRARKGDGRLKRRGRR